MIRKMIHKIAFNAIKYTGGNPLSPQYWVQKLFGSGDSASGVHVDEFTAMKYSAFWSAVNIISGAVGFLPLVTFKRNKDNSRDRATNHAVYNLLHNRPNPYMSAQSFKETLTAHALVWGNAYAEIEYNNSMKPIALWPLLPNKTRCVWDKESDEFYFEVQQDSGTARLRFDQVYHLHGLGFNGITGYSVIEYAADNIGLNMATEKNASAFYANDSSPMGLLTTDSTLEKPVKDKVEEDWENKHKGLDRRYRIAVLHSGLKYQAVGIPAKDAQLLESRKQGVSDIARWFQIPPHMLADMDRATFSNIEHQGIEFVKMTLQRWLEKWKQEADYKLFSKPERWMYFTDFIIDMLLRGDSKTRAEVYQIALGGNNNPGFMTINEVRQRENLPPVDNGGDLFLPGYGAVKDNSDNTQNLFEGIWGRIVTKEVNAIRKALKKPETFKDWAGNFYKRHKTYAESIIFPAVSACFGDGHNPDFEINHYIDQRLIDVNAAFDNGTLEDLVSEWDIYEPEKRTKLLLQGIEQ